MDENLVDQYLTKFEAKNNKPEVIENDENLINDELMLPEEELYSDAGNLSSGKKSNKNSGKGRVGENGEDDDDEDEEDDEDDIDERLLLEKNFFNMNDSDLKENEDELYTCEFCSNHAYKHLTQLKVSHLTKIFFFNVFK